MKVCAACGKTFPAWAMIDGRRRSFQRRQFCLECSPFGGHNTATSPLKVPPAELLEARRRKRNAKTYRCQKKRRLRRKQQLVAAFGNRCVDCGYSVCLAALEFHHKDPSSKEFGLGNFGGSLERLLAEAEKCDLLCASCHRLRHVARQEMVSIGPVVLHRRRRKMRAVEYMGSVCYGCDRNGPPALFEFHHWDAREKDFGLSERGIPHRWEKVLAELEKCVMLCANCHREVHAGVRTIRPTLPSLAEDALPYAA